MLDEQVEEATQWVKERRLTIEIVTTSAISAVLFFTVIHPTLVAIHPAFAFGSEALDSRGGRNFIAYLLVGTVVLGNIVLIAGKMYFEFDDMTIPEAILIVFIVIGLLLPDWLRDRYLKLLPSDDDAEDDVEDDTSTETDGPPEPSGNMLPRKTCYERIRRCQFGYEMDVTCIYCGSEDLAEESDTSMSARQYHCSECERTFNDLTGTLFAQYEMPIEEQFSIRNELQNSVPPQLIAEYLNQDEETIQRYAEDLRTCSPGDIMDVRLTDLCNSDDFSTTEESGGWEIPSPFP